MSDGVIIAAMICLTLIVICILGSNKGGKNGK